MLKATALPTAPGTLYVVATPIGNLEDITLRALRVLREEVSLIACEDTRQTQKLLHHYEIRKPLLSYHEHNESARSEQIVAALQRGESVALVSDAGTPLISDPGYRAVHAAVEAGFSVTSLPGPAAFLTALMAAGLPTSEFRYLGFLPAKAGARRRAIEILRDEPTTTVAYESPHRILDALTDFSDLLPERDLVLARELTKLHEEFLRGTAQQIRQQLAARASIKGEITLVVGGAVEIEHTGDPIAEVAALEATGVGRMDAIKTAAKKLGLPKREVYRRLADAAEEPDSNSPDRHRD